MANNIFLKREDSCVPDGWGNWAFVDNYLELSGHPEQLPARCRAECSLKKDNIKLFNDAPFPKDYLPSRAFWLESVISHCLFIWEFDYSPEIFESGPPEDCYEKREYVYGIGIEPRTPVPNGDYYEIDAPEMGYCIGDLFKQHLYTHLRLEEVEEYDQDCPTPEVIKLYGTPTLQVMQNSRLKRVYVYEGTVKGFYQDQTEAASSGESESETFFLNIGLSSEAVENVISVESTIISVTRIEDNTVVELEVTGITDQGILEVVKVDSESEDVSEGDYYVLDRTWSIEDPYLFSGFWLGTESEARVYTGEGATGYTPESGLELYVTTHNSPYQVGKLMGAYVWSEPYTSIPSYDNMQDVGENSWKFLWLNNTNEYFPDGTRYKEGVDKPKNDICADNYRSQIKGYIDYEEREEASENELERFKEFNSFVRVEIDKGGDRDRHNYFAPCLKGNYIKYDGVLYEIVNHLESHIIDVAKIGIDGESVFSPDAYTEYQIVNQNAWVMTEHYDGHPFECYPDSNDDHGEWGACDGLMKGIVESEPYYDEVTNVTTFNFEVEGDHCGAWIKNAPATINFPAEPPPEINRYVNANNFMNRYRDTHDHLSPEPYKKYNKFKNWKFVLADPPEGEQNVPSEYSIDVDYFDMSYAPEWPEAYNPYTIVMTVKGDATEEISIGDGAFVAFDTTFKTLCWPQETGKYHLDFGPTLEENEDFCRNDGPCSPLCIDGGYFSNQYLLDIPKNYRIGYCEGKYFGVNGCAEEEYDVYNNNSAFLDYGLYLHVSTVQGENVRGISSLFNDLTNKDWVAYQDVNNLKLQIRSGDLDFKARPIKSEIHIGDYVTQSLGDGYLFNLDSDLDRLNRISFKLPEGQNSLQFSIAISTYIGSTVHGFGIDGSGTVELSDPLVANGLDANEWPISPVYIPKLKRAGLDIANTLEIGTRADIDAIEVVNGPLENVKAYYVEENQTIHKNMGFFDIIRISEGQTFLLFNQCVGPFTVGDEYPIWTDEVEPSEPINVNSNKNNKWGKQSGVMVISTRNEGEIWASPFVDKNQLQPDEFLMILNSVEYLTSFFDDLERTVNIFVKCSDGDKEFLGFFKVNYLTFGHKAFECDPLESDGDEEGWFSDSCCNKHEYPEFIYKDEDINRWEV